MPSNELARDAINQSVQTLPDAKQNSSGSWAESLPLLFFGRMPFLPPWGGRRREIFLRNLYRAELNTVFQGGVMGQCKKVASSPFEISGPKSGTAYFQDVFRGAQFGLGWRDMVLRALADFFRQDIGGFIEVIGPGSPTRPISGRITGLAALDALRCFPTGDPEFPVIYRDQKGAAHRMHRSRVIRLVDMPDGDEGVPGPIGLCALSRAAAIVQREMLMGRYIEYSLDDKPKPGILMMRNLTQEKWQQAVSRYLTEQGRDDTGPMGKVITLFGLQPDQPIEAESVTFSEPPQSFDYRVYKVDVDVNEMALALGVDVQELWQLGGSGQRLGTSTQSEILNQKSRGKTFGDILKMLERAFNDVLPTAYEFEFKWRDAQEDQERAQIAATWVGIANQLTDLIPEMRLRLLANQVEAIADVIIDEDGQFVRLSDADPKAPDSEAVGDDTTALTETSQPNPEPAATAQRPPMQTTRNAQPGRSILAQQQPDQRPPTQKPEAARPSGTEEAPVNIESTQGLNGAQINAALTILAGVVTGTTVPSVAVELLMALGIEPERAARMVNDTVKGRPKAPEQVAPQNANTATPGRPAAIKAWGGTRSRFVTLLMDAINAARADDLSRRRFGTVMRAHLRSQGLAAYRDGLKDAGVDPDDMDTRDEAALQEWLRLQSEYVTKFADRVFGQGLSDAQVEMHAEMWANKSLRDAYQLGQASGAWNGMYVWKMGPTREHCVDCLRLEGQIHRMRDWRKKKWIPGSERLTCRGYNCACSLKPAPGKRASGRF